MTEYIEETIREKEQLQTLKDDILKRTEGKFIKQINVENIDFKRKVMRFHAENYELIVSVTFFTNEIRDGLFKIISDIEQVLLLERHS